MCDCIMGVLQYYLIISYKLTSTTKSTEVYHMNLCKPGSLGQVNGLYRNTAQVTILTSANHTVSLKNMTLSSFAA